MLKSNNLGTCFLCQQNIAQHAATKHLQQCLEKHSILDPAIPSESTKEKIFVMEIFAGKFFWLHVAINGSSPLKEFDIFLRKTWLECCGHLSQFKINDTLYPVNNGMSKAIHRLLNTGSSFEYEYDFGSTTELEGKVVAIYPGKLPEDVYLLACNHLPENIVCHTPQCLKKPIVICTVCGNCCCEICKKKHDCAYGEEMMLPVVNSPRMGVCAYTGESENYW